VPHYSLYFLFLIAIVACKDQNPTPAQSEVIDTSTHLDTMESVTQLDLAPISIDYDTTLWTEISIADGILLDLRYATTDNFTLSQIYPCGRCFLRPAVAKRLLHLNEKIKAEKNYQFKLYDCYRPRPAQQRLWDKHPNPTHVMHPSKGSMHNRGAAVDLTLVVIDSGQELDMGTDFDYFGREARHDYTGHNDFVLTNRTYLRRLMEEAGFKSIKSEWWHYSLSGQRSALSSWEWPCPD